MDELGLDIQVQEFLLAQVALQCVCIVLRSCQFHPFLPFLHVSPVSRLHYGVLPQLVASHHADYIVACTDLSHCGSVAVCRNERAATTEARARGEGDGGRGAGAPRSPTLSDESEMDLEAGAAALVGSERDMEDTRPQGGGMDRGQEPEPQAPRSLARP